MGNTVKNITSDAAIATRHLLSGVFLLSGFNVCIAIGAAVAGAITNGSSTASHNFFSIMNYADVAIISPVPEAIAAFNWTTLGAMIIFAAYSALRYVQGAATRPPERSNVVGFSSKSKRVATDIAEHEVHKLASNGL